jgi:DNA-binding SARP family transcriptional activator
MDQFCVHLLGGFEVYRGGEAVTLPPACQRLVALLALKRAPAHRLWVCATLWPRARTGKAISSLRSAMWRLRPAGAEGLVGVDPQYLRLAPHVRVDWHDAVAMTERLLAGDIDPELVAHLLPLMRAGALLDRWNEAWVAPEREAFHELRTRALAALGGADKPHHKNLRCAHRPHAHADTTEARET